MGKLPNFADFILEAPLSFLGVHLEDAKGFKLGIWKYFSLTKSFFGRKNPFISPWSQERPLRFLVGH